LGQRKEAIGKIAQFFADPGGESPKVNARLVDIYAVIRSRKHGRVEELWTFTQIGAKWVTRLFSAMLLR
jgi:hypothetical protein